MVIAASTRRLASGLFEYEALEAVEIKSLVAPALASQVLRETAADSRCEALQRDPEIASPRNSSHPNSMTKYSVPAR
jgi:hypothetical protein